MDFETSKKEIERLVEEFSENEHYYTSPSFDEENTKINFINKFFIALGWDVYNDLGIAPQYKDVEFEDTVIIGGKPKAPDYCFRIGGARKFFVEAKKPSVDIEKDRKYAHQLKRYTWSDKLPIGLLTDFEELAIYEPKSTPKKTHNTSVDRIKYYKYTEYAEKWEEIYNIFSKQAVLTGKFDKFVEDIGGSGSKKGTSTVDSEFLKTIEEWRLELARNIALRNTELSVEELNFAVQLIIDRIIFLRIAEDRGIEPYGQLKKLVELAKNEKDNYPVYEAFIELCKKADAKYNSGLFHFKEEKEISLSADTLTPELHIDDGKLVKIIKELYYPDCPYEFSLISTEILGNIYEQFLGKVIRLTDGHQAKVEDKPEDKKAGGVYYTPQYIVEYIVENTIGELLKGKTPNQVSKLRFVDPACGSGSFLLGAYQKLINWHVEYYSNLEKPPKDVIYTGKDGIPRLTIQEKKRILVNNIYGVDIDSQAVEVTKLSLLLKVLEDTNKDVLEAQQKLIQERALPYLGDNIRCGNSLIGTDILDSEDLTIEEIQEINPFDWEEEFKEIFENGGFDAVIGNPPYFNIQTLGAKSKQISHIKDNYDVYMDKSDILFYFIEKSAKISKNKVGFIISNAFLFSNKAKKLRNFI
ncbi:MAG: N-6 DNA methylase, partial [Methanobrevibacter sp.]|nr:N-6 DNA methylase [Methanobrevibacter sp.]